MRPGSVGLTLEGCRDAVPPRARRRDEPREVGRVRTPGWTPTKLYRRLQQHGPRRRAYVALAVLLAASALLAWPGAAADPGDQAIPDRVRLSVAGSSQVAHEWVRGQYPLSAMTEALWWDLPFAVVRAVMLSLAALLAARYYRTVSTRHLVATMTLAALSAGLLNVV